MAGDNKPREHVVVVGAGMVGLCTAWFLQEHDIEVTVVDRVGVAGGASWGNAGWLTPGISIPLPEPAVLRYGLRTMLSPSSPVYIPPSADIRLMRFLAGFARNSTQSRWRSAMGSLVPINRLALESFDILADGGVRGRTEEAKTFLMAYRTEAERRVMLEELEHIRAAGQEIGFDVLTGKDAQEIEPSLSDEIGAAVLLHDQRFINPGSYVGQLADAVRERGGEIRDGEVTAISDDGPQVRVTVGAQTLSCGSVVLASGAWLGGLARRFGVRTIVQAGRGYSFSVAVDHVPAGPVYFPAQRVACTPLGDRLRVAGMMEFRSPEAALDRRRIEAIADTARPLLRGADLDSRQDEWVGSRPCTPDGLPLIGRTRSRRVLVAGGHGMWGITLGPATGRLLADTIATGRVPAELAPFNPLR
ncbi:NAD(P)/FAD-dependent oxidoreductase [Nocardia donostiensis]|uniref:Amino acid dehydrogenase n=1 Tax=Nocardia donostiensis TaxID=1538463 RepID=A0A1V2TB37_9NOCA|nr:FAD-dependent oxidoreductase [Nocardia donostiensis]ONM46707.1 amino acid dehydrogenase [Nocardia donostiensis]OQS12788.1 amino acid dehydrogenase [Nocardia donostiensis]OQS19330.1 amino acid dehydrogenase [Nocardia donostiensis]